MGNNPIYSGSGKYMNDQEREDMLNRRRMEVQRNQRIQQSPRIDMRSSAFPVGGNQKKLNRPQVPQAKREKIVYKDQKKGNSKKWLLRTSAAFLATLSIAGLVYSGKTIANKHFTYERNRENIVESISDDYYTSMYLRENVVYGDYMKAVESELDSVIAETPGMKDYITATTSNNWSEIGYLCLGEGDRSDFSDNELFKTMVDYSSYVGEFFDGEEIGEGNFITQVCDLASKCTSEANKESIVRLLDVVQGSKSISNGKPALQYQIGENEEHRLGIQRQDNVSGLEENIYTNNNFVELLVDEKDETQKNYRAKTLVKFYNNRVQTAKDIINSETMPDTYKDVFSKYENMSKWDTIPQNFSVPDVGHIKETMDLTEIANYNDFNTYAMGRNDLYQQILEDKSSPDETIARLDKEDETLKKRIEAQENIVSMDIDEILQYLESSFSSERTVEETKESHPVTHSRGVGRDSVGPEL